MLAQHVLSVVLAESCVLLNIAFRLAQTNWAYYPVVNEDKCINCRLCLRVCAALEIESDKLHEQVFAKQPDNPLIEHHSSSWVGYATDPTIRYESTSGGIITALLKYALEQEIIDGALVVGLDKNLRPTPFIARTVEEVVKAKGSKSSGSPLDKV